MGQWLWFRAVASDTRDPCFESSHPQILFTISSVLRTVLKKNDKTKMRSEMAH